MYEVFDRAENFNSDISNWDVSGVTTTAYMFLDAHAFNADLSRWDVAGVTHMQNMFERAETFDRDLGDWDVTAVTENAGFLTGAEQFRIETRCDPFYTPLTNEEICEALRDPLPPGNTRIALQGSQSWYAMASSADGTILVTGSSDGELWKSTESGEPGSWDQLTFGDGQTLGILVDVTVSDDGQSIVVVQSTNKGPVRTSVDGGQHWRTSQPADDATPVVNTDADGCGSPGCSACEGDCDSDSQCAGNLQCFERTSSSDLVPGCASTGYHGESNPWDYCYDPTQGGSGPPTVPPPRHRRFSRICQR
jgi:surface protein